MDSAASAMVMVVLRWCPLRHSSLRTHFLYDYSYGKMLGTIICGPERYWKKNKKYTFYRMTWCSITRRGHIKSQYLQIVLMVSMMLWGNPGILSYHGACVASTHRHTTVCWWWKNECVSMRTRHGATGKSNHWAVWLRWVSKTPSMCLQ